MIWFKLLICLLAALTTLYCFFYWQQLRLMRREVKQIVTLHLLFITLLMTLGGVVLTAVLLASVGISKIMTSFA